jgi:hypothetical protein
VGEPAAGVSEASVGVEAMSAGELVRVVLERRPEPTERTATFDGLV